MKYLQNLYGEAANLNRANILKMFERNPQAVFLDLGCDDGSFSEKIAKKIKSKKIIGVDIVTKRLLLAKKRKIKTIKSDLNLSFPVEKDSVDALLSNQVIEHISNLDKYMSEVRRVLKPGGYAVLSTENASSWCNVFALLFGWQMFSLTNISSKSLGIGNPLALHRNEKLKLSSWTHKTIFSIRGFIEFAKVWGFSVEDVKGAGYFPLPALFGNIDKTHSHFITIKIRKQ